MSNYKKPQEGPIADYLASNERSTETIRRRVPGSGIRQTAVPSMPQRPALPRATQPLGGGRPTLGLGQLFKLTFTPEVPKRWRHLSIIALAAMVATISIDSKAITAQPQVGGNYAQPTTTTAQAQSLVDVQLPAIKSVDLPPVPVKNDAARDINLLASHVVVIDDKSKLPLYEKAGDERIAVASTTKIMTAYVALRHYKDLQKRVDISNAAINQIGSAVGFYPGESATIEQLLYGLMLPSGNDAALALAEQFTPAGGQQSVEAFVAEMNRTAAQLGMNHTRFQDPAGLRDDGYSTASEMAKLMAAAIKLPEFNKIIGTLNYSWTSPENRVHQINNSNRLIGEMYYDGTIGGKTGFTPKTAEGGAGHCLIVAATRNGHTLIAAVFDTYSQTASASAEVARAALEYGFNNYTWQEVAR